jgi:hypothetical protein
MARKYWRGGANALRGQGSASDDGNWDYDTVTADSNWVNDSGAGVAKPVDGVDEAIFSEFAETVPSDYSQAAEPHVPGKHFCCCHGMDQGSGGGDIDLLGLTFTPGYDPGAGKGLFDWESQNLTATETDSADAGASTLIYCSNTFEVGDYVTIGGTVLLNGEWRMSARTSTTFTIPLAYAQETPPTSATAVARKPLRIGIAANYKIVFQSNCTAYIEASHDTLNIEECMFDSVSGLLHLSSDVVGVHNWNEIRMINNGTIVIADACEFTKLIISKSATLGAVLVGKGCLGPSAVSCDLEINAGSCAWDSKAGDIELNGGTLVYCLNTGLSTQVDIDLIEMRGNGIVEWYGKRKISDIEAWSGVLTAKGSGVKSIDSGTTKDFLLHGGTVDLSQAGGPITLGTNNNFDCRGGTLHHPKFSIVNF